MKPIQTVSEMQTLAHHLRAQGKRLALVPTMGALHAGHLALVQEARSLADHVTVSIFVNPTQFGPGEDFDRYPRTWDKDLEALASVGGVDAIFAPTVASMYPDGPAQQRIWVEVEEMDQCLCGRHRPGHFRGVVTVVSKLFNACLPHVAVFGTKDAQQFVIIRRLARDLNFGIEIVGVPTVREADGLALSSRNAYLSTQERAQAVVLSQAVALAQRRIEEGEQQIPAIVKSMHQWIEQAPLAVVQYVDLVDASTLLSVDQLVPGREVIAAVAVFFGTTRLIDNAFIHVPGAPSEQHP